MLAKWKGDALRALADVRDRLWTFHKCLQRGFSGFFRGVRGRRRLWCSRVELFFFGFGGSDRFRRGVDRVYTGYSVYKELDGVWKNFTASKEWFGKGLDTVLKWVWNPFRGGSEMVCKGFTKVLERFGQGLCRENKGFRQKV